MEKWAIRRIRRSLCALLAGLALIGLLLPDGAASRVTAPAADGPLKGRIIAIDPGHGGYDGGARAPGGRWEKAYNLDVSLALRDYLYSLGATVVMTRDGDYALCDPNPKMRKKRQDMERRAELVLLGQSELLVSVHMNEYRDKSQAGPQVFFRKDCQASRALAEVMQTSMVEELSPKRKREALPGDFYMLSLGIPSVLVECGFLSNAAEEALLRTDAYVQRMAAAIGEGIVDWFAVSERPTAAPREDR